MADEDIHIVFIQPEAEAAGDLMLSAHSMSKKVSQYTTVKCREMFESAYTLTMCIRM